jgi:hypothetical protein
MTPFKQPPKNLVLKSIGYFGISIFLHQNGHNMKNFTPFPIPIKGVYWIEELQMHLLTTQEFCLQLNF